MKVTLIPVYFDPGRDENFDKNLNIAKDLLKEEVEFTSPLPLGSDLPDADGVIFPQMLGEAYRNIEKLKAITLPILIITSDAGTVNMWDWELVHYLKLNGIQPICPTSLEDTRLVCRALLIKRLMAQSKFVVYQDDPAGPSGQQSDIFKRFYWLEKESSRSIFDTYGITIEQRSFKKLVQNASQIPDDEAQGIINRWKSKGKSHISERALLSAIKLYMVLKKEYLKDEAILAMGLNCLNESKSCDTTPCLAWNLLYAEEKLIWGCEADTMTMLTEIFADKILQVPFFMTNLYPFIMGKAALSHERIPHFPEVDEPDNHILAAHCGYFGLVPETFADTWKLKKKVLAIVNENAHMLDATLPTGKVTLVKFQPYLKKVSISEAELTGYVQYENSDCLNGGIIKVRDGRNFVDNVVSHHYIVMDGHQIAAMKLIANIFNYELDVI